MRLSSSLIAVKRTTSPNSRSEFSNDNLEQAARLILDAEGLVNPIVVRRIDIESYEVIEGHFEYYAAARAREIDPLKGEMLEAFIVNSDNEEVIQKQVKLFRKPQIDIKNKDVSEMDSQIVNLESRFTNLESRSEKRDIDFQIKIEDINKQLKELQQKLPKPIEPLEALNTLSLSDLTSRLNRIGVKTAIIEKIVIERNKNGNFNSCNDVVNRVKGLGDKTMIKIIDYFLTN